MRYHFKLLIFLLCITLPLMFLGIHQSMISYRYASRGDYFFEKTRNNLHIKEIILNFPNETQISLFNNEHFWHIKEIDGYYASFDKIDLLMKLLRESVIYRSDPLLDNQSSTLMENAISIKVIDDKGNTIDSAIIAPKREQNRFHYALLNDNTLLYQVMGDFNLSSQIMNWAQMPLLAIDYSQIQSVQSDNIDVYRPFQGTELRTVEGDFEVPQMQALMNNFWYLGAEDVLHAVHFGRQDYKLIKKFDIKLFNGLIYKLSLFKKDNEYWLSITLDRDMSLGLDAARFIKENTMLFEGWFFKINAQTGATITSFIL